MVLHRPIECTAVMGIWRMSGSVRQEPYRRRRERRAHYSRRRHPDALGKNSGCIDEGWSGFPGLGTAGDPGRAVGCGAGGGTGCDVDCGIVCGVGWLAREVADRTGWRLRCGLGNGMGSRWRWLEAISYLSAPDISSKTVGVFVVGGLDGLVEGLTEIARAVAALGLM